MQASQRSKSLQQVIDFMLTSFCLPGLLFTPWKPPQSLLSYPAHAASQTHLEPYLLTQVLRNFMVPCKESVTFSSVTP
eukprot:scaffold231441_cov17-Tisochrysis_lutea.AAC.1